MLVLEGNEKSCMGRQGGFSLLEMALSTVILGAVLIGLAYITDER